MALLQTIPQDKVRLNILRAEVGDINEKDIKMAKTSNAYLIAFSVKVDQVAEAILHNMQVEVHYFDVIYDMAKKVREFMDALLVTEKQRIDLGELDVLAIFRTEKNKQIVGGRVMDGKIEDGALGEIYRDNEKIGEGKVIGLEVSRKKADVAYKNSEAGLLFQGKEKVQEGDILRFYKEEFIRPTI